MKASTQAALRPFDESDWQAFAGAESANPHIAEWDDGTVLIWDGTSIQIFTHDEEGEMTGFYSTADINATVAENTATLLVEDINEHGNPRQTALRAKMHDHLGPDRAMGN